MSIHTSAPHRRPVRGDRTRQRGFAEGAAATPCRRGVVGPLGRIAAIAALGLSGCSEQIELGIDASVAPPVDAGPRDAGPDPDGPPPDPVELIADDPFGDGTAFSFVAGFGGQVYLGPAANGGGAVRFNADGSSAETVSFSFAADTTGNASRNASPPPYSSIGRTGCAADTAECGPDNEDGRGLFASGVIGGTEYLIVGGARSGGDLDFVYMTSSTASPLPFAYVDLSAEQGPQTRGYSALHVFGDRLYMGFPDTGGGRPFMHALVNPPAGDGLDAVPGTDFFNLEADELPGMQTPENSIIDSFTDFADRLYLANDGAWIRSNNAAPGDAQSAPGDWLATTPSAPAYAAKDSVATLKTADIEPADKAVPQMTAFAGRLYAARNTTDGPQLWACDPATAAPQAHCDPDDWTLVAANASGDTQLTQFDNPNNAAVSMLVATSTHLYVGFDNPTDGAAVLRTSASAPAAGDFEVVGQAGLGDAANTRIFDAKALNLGGSESVYAVVGSGASGVKVYRLR